MIYTLFFSRLADDLDDAQRDSYEEVLAEMQALARENPGFVDQRTFSADDGERLTVVRFRDRETQAAWRSLPEHVEAQRSGRASFYQEYRVVVCESLREGAWSRDEGFRAPAERAP